MSYEPKVQISAAVERGQKEYLDRMAAQAGMRGYGEALRELLAEAIEARQAKARVLA